MKREPLNLSESPDQMDKSAVRRGWLLILAIMVAFIALTKIFPDTQHNPSPAQQISEQAKPAH